MSITFSQRGGRQANCAVTCSDATCTLSTGVTGLAETSRATPKEKGKEAPGVGPVLERKEVLEVTWMKTLKKGMQRQGHPGLCTAAPRYSALSAQVVLTAFFCGLVVLSVSFVLVLVLVSAEEPGENVVGLRNARWWGPVFRIPLDGIPVDPEDHMLVPAVVAGPACYRHSRMWKTRSQLKQPDCMRVDVSVCVPIPPPLSSVVPEEIDGEIRGLGSQLCWNSMPCPPCPHCRRQDKQGRDSVTMRFWTPGNTQEAQEARQRLPAEQAKPPLPPKHLELELCRGEWFVDGTRVTSLDLCPSVHCTANHWRNFL